MDCGDDFYYIREYYWWFEIIFFLYGLFVEIVFDKGFKFVFGECEIFLKENGKCYMKFVLYYFVFNGEVDRVVCIFK